MLKYDNNILNHMKRKPESRLHQNCLQLHKYTWLYIFLWKCIQSLCRKDIQFTPNLSPLKLHCLDLGQMSFDSKVNSLDDHSFGSTFLVEVGHGGWVSKGVNGPTDVWCYSYQRNFNISNYHKDSTLVFILISWPLTFIVM